MRSERVEDGRAHAVDLCREEQSSPPYSTTIATLSHIITDAESSPSPAHPFHIQFFMHAFSRIQHPKPLSALLHVAVIFDDKFRRVCLLSPVKTTRARILLVVAPGREAGYRVGCAKLRRQAKTGAEANQQQRVAC